MTRGATCLNPAALGSRLWKLFRVVLLLAAGCQLPAATVATDEHSLLTPTRQVVLARQVSEDTVLQLLHRPLQSILELSCSLADELANLAEGELGKRLLLPRSGPPTSHDPGKPLSKPLLADTPLQPAGVRLYLDGGQALEALERLIDEASCRLDVLMFEWENDEIGGRIAARLLARADQGIRVRVLADGGGNLVFGRPFNGSAAQVNAALTRLARHPAIEVRRIRNPFGRLDHRKLVLADGREAWTGGRNLVRRAFCEQHDLSFTLTGPLVTELDRSFEARWLEQGGPARLVCAEFATAPSVPDPPDAWARLAWSGPGCRELQAELYRVVDQARQYLYLENVYFTDSRLICKLARARQRGVEVRVVLTVQSTNPAINRANRVTANRLLQAGVRVYLYPGMTHVKAAAADGCWGYLGTANFDPLSLRRNYEVGLLIGAGPVLGELEERLFEVDCRPEWELTEPLPVSLGDYVCELIAGLWL